MSSEAEDQLTI